MMARSSSPLVRVISGPSGACVFRSHSLVTGMFIGSTVIALSGVLPSPPRNLKPGTLRIARSCGVFRLNSFHMAYASPSCSYSDALISRLRGHVQGTETHPFSPFVAGCACDARSRRCCSVWTPPAGSLGATHAIDPRQRLRVRRRSAGRPHPGARLTFYARPCRPLSSLPPLSPCRFSICVLRGLCGCLFGVRPSRPRPPSLP